MKDSKNYPTYPERFPEGFMNIGGKTFKWVLENKQEFVKFTLNEMEKPTGLFRQWQEYCKRNVNNKSNENGTPGISNVREP